MCQQNSRNPNEFAFNRGGRVWLFRCTNTSLESIWPDLIHENRFNQIVNELANGNSDVLFLLFQ